MTIDRRTFLRRAAIITAGVVAADQLELVERLGWKRKFFPSAAVPRTSDMWIELYDVDMRTLLRISVFAGVTVVDSRVEDPRMRYAQLVQRIPMTPVVRSERLMLLHGDSLTVHR